VAPYHGLPGKLAALRTVFAAAELMQAKTLAVVDPGGPATTPERVTELILPIAGAEVEFLTPCYSRRPRDGVLVTQLVRPVVRALYGVALDEPLGAEFACSGRFASHCLERCMWDSEAARFAIDLWLRTEAAANGFALGQIWRPTTATGSARPGLRETVHQVIIALVESIREHASFWRNVQGVAPLRRWGSEPEESPQAPTWDYSALAEQARRDIAEIEPLLAEVLEEGLLAQVVQRRSPPEPPLDDELWARIVYTFAAASQGDTTRIEDLASMFVPLYLWRAAAFMEHALSQPDATVQARLESLCQTFERLKPVLVNRWSAAV
jgi:hypothetical protein